MEVEEYFRELSGYFSKAYQLASSARLKGFDPETFIETKAAPDFAARVEGIIGVEGLAQMIKEKGISSRQELAFAMVKEICTNPRFEMEAKKRLTLGVRIGLAVLTEGVLVAPTEGFQGIKLHRNHDGSNYVALIYAGPIRGAGGTSTALSVALADYGRRMLGIGDYKPQKTEIERCLEEIMLYHTRVARLQYLPKDDDIRVILENCAVCIDGLPTERIEVSVHRDVRRLDEDGKEEAMTNRIRGGMPLVVCEGIAQKAKSVFKFTKAVGLDWLWLNSVIKVDKGDKPAQKAANSAVFLQELVAGRPVLAYPGYTGAFRLRYGRSRFTGIAAKGFNPATMIALDSFIACGTQLKVEKPGKGCIAMPVDSIEGPFVKLDDGTALRLGTAEEARACAKRIRKILAVGDILVTYGDFKKSNTPLVPTSYVEEYWYEQLKAGGYSGVVPEPKSFAEALQYSVQFGVPMHPKYIYNYNDLSPSELKELALIISGSGINKRLLLSIDGLRLPAQGGMLVPILERLCVPHAEMGGSIMIARDDAQALIASLGLAKGEAVDIDDRIFSAFNSDAKPTEILSGIAGFRVMQRAAWIGARVGRPEKARERLMRPPPNALFPVGECGGKERSITKAYQAESRRFGSQGMVVDIARYRCSVGGERLAAQYCAYHGARARIERVCRACGATGGSETCSRCGGQMLTHGQSMVRLAPLFERAIKKLGLEGQSPKLVKGVKGMMSNTKEVEPLEKGILRSRHNLHIFKDGTARFDATDVPITHFYPKEVGTSVERLRQLGYTRDYLGNELASETQLVEMHHQDVILNRRGGEFMLRTARFIDELLTKLYGLERFYNAETLDDMVGHCVVTLAPHTSCGVLNRIIGYTEADIGFAHPYTITGRRRNCDGDEDTTMLLLDVLINFSKRYLPTTIGGTMDTPLIISTNLLPEEVDDEVWEMEVVSSLGREFYDRTFTACAPGDVQVERVGSRLNRREIYRDIMFTHPSGPGAVASSPSQCTYVKLKTMAEKIEVQFKLMDRLGPVDKADTARKLILSHFIPDLIGNLHSFSRQTFRCIECNAKYSRVPITGKCRRCGGKLVLTIHRGGIVKYLDTAIGLAERYDLESYIRQRLALIKEEITNLFAPENRLPERQFDLTKYM